MGRIMLLAGLALFSTVTLASLEVRISDQQKAIERYQSIVDSGGWKPIDDSSLLKRGDRGAAVDRLIARLKATGDLSGNADAYAEAVAQAVRQFQRRHGLKVDGIVGSHTFAALNVSAQARLDVLKLNLERMRQRKSAADATEAIVVNVPDFHLEYRQPDSKTLRMRVIVGESAWDTPSMTESLESVVFNPTWNIPVEIVAAELAPKVAKNPDYLSENNMVVLSDGFKGSEKVDPSTIDWANVSESNFPYFVREEPGPENPLGEIKFLFPNNDDIYLHDTPDVHLFDQRRRALSHGCIRLEKPFELARAILGEETVSRYMGQKSTQWVSVDPHVPVYLVYWTAWVDGEGTVQFRKDIYNRDGAHENS